VLDRVIEFLRPYLSVPWGYVIVGVATFLENSVGVGVIVPGETLVILGGFYARVGDLWLPLVALVAVVGAILGDNVGYWIGRRFGRGFLERHGRKLSITRERLERVEAYYGSHGGKTVFLGRFVPFLRSVGFIVAGLAEMPWRRFLLYDVVGAVIWGVGHSALGYLVGASYEDYAPYFGLGILVVLVLLIGGSTLARRRRKQSKGPEPSAERRTAPDRGTDG
jgi:membrane protein DedA with SNARE-associated domain